MSDRYEVVPVGWVESPLLERAQAPRQGDEGAPSAWLVFEPSVAEAVGDLHAGEHIIVVSWLDRATGDPSPDRVPGEVLPRLSAPVGCLRAGPRGRPGASGMRRRWCGSRTACCKTAGTGSWTGRRERCRSRPRRTPAAGPVAGSG